MDRSTLKAQFARIGVAVLAGAILMAANAILYWKALPGDETAAREVGVQLRALQRLDAGWEGLLARATTDPGSASQAAGLAPAADRALEAIAQATAHLQSPALAAGLADLARALRDKANLTQRYLADAGFVATNLPLVRAASDRYAEALRGSRAGDAGGQARLGSLERAAGRLASELLAYAADPSQAHADGVQAALAQITPGAPVDSTRRAEEARTALAGLAAAVAGRRQAMSTTLSSIVASPASRQLERLATDFDQERLSRAAAQQNYGRILLWSATALLAVLALVGWMLLGSYRVLDRANTELSAANESLEERVAERTRELTTALAELQQSEAQLIQSEKMSSLGQMVAGVAHEINTPLAYVKNNLAMVEDRLVTLRDLVESFARLLEMLQAEDTPDETLRAQFARVSAELSQLRGEDSLGELGHLVRDGLHGIDQISEIVVNLKDFSRLDRQRMQSFDVNKGLESTLLLARHVLKQVEVRCQFGLLPPVMCAASQINQVFLNLITNAAQATEGRRGVITLTTRAVGKSVMVEVQDNGRGIPQHVLPRIFDPFFTTKEAGKGTGLGLSICYKIIDQHHGKIMVMSRPGEGTTFTVLLPAQSTAADLTPPPAPALAPAGPPDNA